MDEIWISQGHAVDSNWYVNSKDGEDGVTAGKTMESFFLKKVKNNYGILLYSSNENGRIKW